MTNNEDAPEGVRGLTGRESGQYLHSGMSSQDAVRRRRFLKGGAASAAFIMTLSSKSALGGPCTISGALSGNLSIDHDAQFCGGRSPGYWKRNLNDTTTRFVDVFGGVWHGHHGPWDPGVTLKQVIDMTGNQDRYQFGAHAVAAYLNALVLPAYPMTTQDVVKVVQAILSPAGIYVDPVTGKTLDAIEVRDFFFGTFDAG